MLNDSLSSRIIINPSILAGKPIIRGMRISVEQVLQSLAGALNIPDTLQEYPELELDDIKAVLLYAADLVKEEKVLLLEK
ncbi:MAG: DUF433 domain-containing protein [Brevinematales bacterium]|nr:DUF433 domain-containing protein [Brevinematales bacterium]